MAKHQKPLVVTALRKYAEKKFTTHEDYMPSFYRNIHVQKDDKHIKFTK